MSRIGKKPIQIPEGVTVTVEANNNVVVKGPKGELNFKFHSDMKFVQEDNVVSIETANNSKMNNTMSGTTRALLNNMVEGVSKGYQKALEIKGVGYRAALKGSTLTISAGYSHPVDMEVPTDLTVEVPTNTEVVVKGVDKQKVGQFAAQIRDVRPPEPYKGKGIRYKGEYVRRKEGKTAK